MDLGFISVRLSRRFILHQPPPPAAAAFTESQEQPGVDASTLWYF